MAAYFATPKSSVTAVSAATATACPAVPQASRLLIKLFSDDPDDCYWGDSTVDDTKGIPFNGESDWIPCSGAIYVWSKNGCNVRTLEGA